MISQVFASKLSRLPVVLACTKKRRKKHVTDQLAFGKSNAVSEESIWLLRLTLTAHVSLWRCERLHQQYLKKSRSKKIIEHKKSAKNHGSFKFLIPLYQRFKLM